MRYLFTPDAGKKQGGVQFTPVTRVGGQLYGTLAVETGADEILKAGGRWVREISAEDFNAYELRRADFSKAKNSFPIPDLTHQVLPQIQRPAPKPTASATEVLTPKPIKS